MVPLARMARIALAHDTSMARAMLRALGVPVPEPWPAPGRVVRSDVYDGMLWCFANHGSPMDRVR